MKAMIIRTYQPEFPIAPTAKANERVTFLRADPKNPAWFFGRDARGIEGFFPRGWFAIDQDAQSAVARRDYAAAELRVIQGDIVALDELHGGWLLVRAADGSRGWIPENHATFG